MSDKPGSCARDECDEPRVYHSHLCREHYNSYQRERYYFRRKQAQENAEYYASLDKEREEQEAFERESARILATYGPAPKPFLEFGDEVAEDLHPEPPDESEPH